MPEARKGRPGDDTGAASTTDTTNSSSVPHDTDAERAVLGSLITIPGLLGTVDLDDQAFYEPVHERIYRAIRGCLSEHQQVDAVLLKDELLRECDRLPEVGGLTYIADLVAAVPVDSGPHVEIIKRDAAARRALAALVQAQVRIEQGAEPATALAELKGVDVPATLPRRRGRLVPPDQVHHVRQQWIKRDWYPCDVATMIAGRGGELKSTLTLGDVAAGTRGELHGKKYGTPVRTVLVATEDSQSMQKSRLRAARADERYYTFFIVEDCQKNEEVAPAIPGDIPELKRTAEEFKADLIIIDPLSSVVHGNLDKGDIIRAAMDPLSKLAKDLNIAIVVVHHFRKGGGQSQDLASNSHVIRDAVRSYIQVGHDKDTDTHIVTFDKSNYSKMEGKSLEFTVESVQVIDDDGNPEFDEEGNPETVPVTTVGAETDLSVEQIVNRAGGQDSDDEHDCASWLRNWAASEGGELDAGEVRKVVDGAGFSWSAAKRARAKLAMTTRREGFGKGSHNVWALPAEAADHHRARIEPIGTMSQEASPMGSMASPMDGELAKDSKVSRLKDVSSSQSEPLDPAPDAPRAPHAPDTGGPPTDAVRQSKADPRTPPLSAFMADLRGDAA